jgi:phospholipase C
MRINRRTVLKGLGAAAVVPAISRCTPEETGPTEVTPALLRERVKTVVVLMMENRSFDHLFGSLSLLEGRTDVDGLTAEMSNPLLDGTPVPVQLSDKACVLDPNHAFDGSHEQWNLGANDGFVRVHESRYGTDEAHRVMGYLDRARAPASYALADRYALCQRWFASVMGPTWPNRFYSLLATSDGNKRNVPLNDLTLPTMFTRLDEAHVKWAQYYGNFPFSGLLPNHSIEQPEYGKLDKFFDDAAAGTLPSYVHLDPIFGLNDDHPPAHPMSGQLLIASIYAALAQSPQWKECLFVITYDEHGGFFDHVSPPTTVDARSEFQQLGFRVPSLVIGPYVKPQVSSTVFDHTSIIASVLRQHELDPLNGRDEAANDLWSLLDEQALLDGKAEDPITLDPIEVDETELEAEECKGSPLHIPAGVASYSSGQPELEAFFKDRVPGRDLPAEGPEAYARLIARARELGVAR